MNRNLIISTYENNVLLFKNSTTGFLDADLLTYHTEDAFVKINFQIFSFTKENNESIFKLTKNTCYLKLKELNQVLNIPLEFIEFTYQNNEINLEYKLASNEHNIKVKIEIGSDINGLSHLEN